MNNIQSSSLWREARATALLSLPLAAGQVSQMLMGVVDTVMIGRLGTVELAASTFANSVLYIPLMFGVGVAIAVSVKVSQARGSETASEARAALRHGLFMSLGLGVLTLLVAFALLSVFPFFGQDPEVMERVPVYFLLVALSMTPAMGSMAVKSHADAMNIPWPPFFIMLGGVLLNILLNWIFIYGNLGIPEMGLEGAGIATVLARVLSLCGLLFWCRQSSILKDWVPHRWFRKPDSAAMRELISIAWPSSLQVSAETSAFVVAAIMVGSLGAVALASHQVAISCAAVVFMVPLGVSMALTVRIGEAKGAKEFERWRPIMISGLLMGLLVSLTSVTVFVLLNDQIARGFVKEQETIKLAASLLIVAAFFQIGDHAQIISVGVLRGLDDVKTPAWLVFLSFWGIAMPLGWYMTFRMDMGAHGMWWGLTTGLTLTAVLLGIRAWRKTGVPVGGQ